MNKRLLWTVLAGATATGAFAADFFVAPGGRDDQAGTRQKPFATFQRAQEAVRSERVLRANEGVTVTFLAGTYALEKPIEFTSADSGASAENPVCYRAEPGATVVISGGKPIAGWQRDTQRPGVWKTRIATPQSGDDTSWRFEQLWINGQRAIRARTPNYWEFDLLSGVAEAPAPAGAPGVIHTFSVKPESLATLKGISDADLKDVQIVVFHSWDTTRERLNSASIEEGQLTSFGEKMQPWNPIKAECLYYLENHFSALDAPGEWFLARDGWLYYIPRDGEDMASAQAVAPRVDRFLVFAGEVGNSQRWVQHVRMEGLKFRFAELRVPPGGIPPVQAAMSTRATAIQLDGARDIQFRDCAVEHIGMTAFWFRQDCQDCRVEHTRMFDMGVGGVRIGEMNIVPEAVRTRGITIDNCIVQSGGRIVPQAVGVWIGHSPDNAITHCDIGDFFYTAVSVGWRWGYDESPAKRNKIEFNHLHHLGYRILSDMGGVYTLGPSEGTTVRNNVIHDVYSTRYGGWGLYTDEGSTGILLENNLVYDVRDGCMHQHYGKENIFRNNILAFSEEGQVAATRAEPHLSFTFERNIVYWDEGRLLGYSGWGNNVKANMRTNLYYRAGGKPFDFNGKSWEAWRAAGNDDGSVISDPLFVDAQRRDFRLRPGSPAEKIGFKPFDFTQAGVHGDREWKKLAEVVVYPKPYVVVPPPQPLTLRDDFERGASSPLLIHATLSPQGRKDLISITDTVAASGTHSLKIQDRPDLKEIWDPHFYWDPCYSNGAARLSYKIRFEPGSSSFCEWRSQGHPYRIGPSLQLHDKGLFVRGQKLLDLPENAWIGIEMCAVLGKADSRWNLTVKLPDGKTQEFKDLACDTDWKEARWVGFCSMAAKDVSFYLDDLVMENR